LAKGKKKTKKGPKGGAKQQRDMSKVKCFACNKMGHYVEHCPNRKKKKQGGTAARAKEDEFVSKFERECSLIVCCSIVETPSCI
jgi:hypothetical protein